MGWLYYIGLFKKDPENSSLKQKQFNQFPGPKPRHFRPSRHSRASALDLVHSPWRPLSGTPLRPALLSQQRQQRQQQRFNGEWICSDAPGNWADASGAKIFCDIYFGLIFDWIGGLMMLNDVLKFKVFDYMLRSLCEIWFPFGAIGNMCKLLRTCDMFLNLKDRRKNNFIRVGWRCRK